MRTLGLGALFFLTGAAGLVVQACGLRLLGDALGHTSRASAVVVGGFLLGLSGGGWVFRHPRRPLTLFFVLEALAALSCAALLVGAALAGTMPRWPAFAAGFAAVLPGSFFLGGTLPALSAAFVRRGRAAGWLYALNTLGGGLGAVLAGYVFFGLVGVRVTLLGAAAVEFACGAAALLFGEEGTGAPGARPRARAKGYLLLAFVAGFSFLAMEMIWLRLMRVALDSTVFAASASLGVFLAGLGGGGLFASFFVRRRNAPAAAGVALALSGVLALVGIEALGSSSGGPASSAFILPAVVAAGMVMPLLFRAFGEVGALYAMSCAGSVLGALAGDLVLVRAYGSQGAMAAVAAAAAFAGAFAAVGRRRAAANAAALAGLVIAFLCAPPLLLGLYGLADRPAALVSCEEDEEGLVTVHVNCDEGYMLLACDGVDVAGSSFALRCSQRLQGHLPMLLARGRERALLVGLGSGESARSSLLHSPGALDVVEISPGVVRAAREFFGHLNAEALDSPSLNLFLHDARAFLLRSQRSYDVVMNDSTWPFLTSSSALYSLEHFRACAERLNEGGVVSCWVPLDLGEEGTGLIVRTFLAAFPESTLWTLNAYETKHALLIGRKAGDGWTGLDRIAPRLSGPAMRDLEGVDLASAEEMLALCALDARGLRDLAGEGGLNTIDRPLIEYCARRRGAYSWREDLLASLERIRTLRPDRPFGWMGGTGGTGGMDRAWKEAGGRLADKLDRLRGELSALPHLSAAREARRAGAFERSLELYAEAAAAAPEWHVPRVEFGDLLAGNGRLDEAAREYAAAARANPRRHRPWARLSAMLRLLGREEEAREARLRAEELFRKALPDASPPSIP